MDFTVAVLASAAFWTFYRTLRPLGWILLGQFLALGVTACLFLLPVLAGFTTRHRGGSVKLPS